MTLRHAVAHHLVRIAIRLTEPNLTVEGMLVMKIWDAIVDLRKQVAAINVQLASHGTTLAGAVDPDAFAALKTAVAALPTNAEVATAIGAAMEEIVGDEPADPDDPDNGASTIPAATGSDSISGGAGADTLSGGNGADSPNAGAGDASGNGGATFVMGQTS